MGDGRDVPDDQPFDWDPWHEADVVGAANLGVRALAFLVDWTVLYVGMAATLFVAVYNLGLGGGGGDQVPFAGNRFTFNVVAGIVEVGILLAYFGVLEHRFGQTLGKRLFGIEVVDEAGALPSVGAALTRRLPFVVGPLLPGEMGSLVLVGVGIAALVTAAQDRRAKRGFHDRWARTLVRRVR